MKRALFLSLLLAAGCGASYPEPVGPVPGGLAKRDYALMQHWAARLNGCPKDQLHYEPFGSSRHLFTGCGREIELLLEHTTDGDPIVRPSPSNRFAKERRCAVRDTTDERIDHRTRLVEGCGARVTYVAMCDGQGDWGCVWAADLSAAGTPKAPEPASSQAR